MSGREVELLEEVDLRHSVEPASAQIPHRRLATFRGIAREVGSIAFSLAVWPVGLVDEAVQIGARRVRRPLKTLPRRSPRARHPDTRAAEVPIILIHGYFHNRSGFMVMQRALRRHGFCNVIAFGYNPLGKSIPEIAEKLGCRVEEVLASTGADKVHFVGHSLGGLIARYYVEYLGGKTRTHTLVTLGAPHRGTLTAYAGRSQSAKQMRPGSEFMARMSSKGVAGSVRYFSYYSNLDALVVPAESAILAGGNGNVTNVLVHDLGHLSLLIDQELIEEIAGRLSEL